MIALGIVLIVCALILMLAEAHLSTGGMSFALGSLALIGGVVLILVAEEASTGVVVAVALGALALSTIAFFALRRRITAALAGKPTSGREILIGHDAVVRSVSNDEAQVFLEGSLWKALAPGDELQKGDHVTVESVDGLTLKVHKAEAEGVAV